LRFILCDFELRFIGSLLIAIPSDFQPHDHQKKVAKFYYATPDLLSKAIEASLEAKKEWNRVPIEDRMKLFLNVADQVS
jgi:acyl-CoA reductase-like NAD-dependent aldehyde dehydrogenase